VAAGPSGPNWTGLHVMENSINIYKCEDMLHIEERGSMVL
jgi:hypothetical protein